MGGFIERPRTACALGGALATISALPGVVPVVHSALGCAGNLSNAAAFGSGYCGSSYCSGQSVSTSAVTETEIVFGGTERLAEEIEAALELIDADLFLVLTSCMTEMIGDDVEGVVSEFREEGKPVLALSTPSFKGDAYSGYSIVLEGVFNRYLPKARAKNPKLVNIFGLVPSYDPFFRGDLSEIKRLLEKLGLQVNTFFTPDQTFANLTSAPEAALNILFSRAWGVEFAENFARIHGTPYLITDLPIGPEATDLFLREIGKKLEVESAYIEKVIEQENKEYYGYFQRAVDLFADSDYKFYAAVIANSNNAIPYARFLERELGWIPKDIFVTDILREDQKDALRQGFEAQNLLGELIFESDTSRIEVTLRQRHARDRGEPYFDDDLSPLYILGSSLEKQLALGRGANYLSVSFPVYNRVILDRGYAGYRGGLHLFEDLVDVLVAPK